MPQGIVKKTGRKTRQPLVATDKEPTAYRCDLEAAEQTPKPRKKPRWGVFEKYKRHNAPGAATT